MFDIVINTMDNHLSRSVTAILGKGSFVSGLFGVIDTTGDTPIHPIVETSAARMSHRPWYVSEQWYAPDIPLALGRIGIGVFNPEPQPIISEDGQHILFMSGEIYNRQRLSDVSQLPPTLSDPELALHAFRAHGRSFASQLDGAFFIVIYSVSEKCLFLTNDRFGLYPHFYWHAGKRLVFAPEVKGVLSAPFVPRKLNDTAVAEYMRFQQVLGEKTFHEGVRLFPRATLAEYNTASGTWTTFCYWDWSHLPDQPGVGFEEAVEEAGRLLGNAVERRAVGTLRPGVFLSGGLDSRTILGLMPPRTPPPVSASFGVRNSRDVYYAERIARAMGSQHYWFDMPDGNWILDNFDLHLKLTEGFHSWIHMHSIHTLSALREVMDYNLTGWDGGTVMGHLDHINPIYNNPVDEWTIIVESFKQFNQSYTWPGISEAEEKLLYTPEFGKQAIGRALDSMIAEYRPYWQFRRHYAAEFFYVDNHCMRLTQNMVTVARSHLEMRFPFWDYALIDFIYSLRPEVRGHQILYRHIITRLTPALAVIPYDKQEFLPTVRPIQHNLQALSVRARRRLRLFPRRPTLYADYENYLRHELRSWAESILFDRRTEERGIFNVPFVHSLMARHLAGHEQWILGKIAPLITLEMVLREWVDS